MQKFGLIKFYAIEYVTHGVLWNVISAAPDRVMNIITQFSPNNTIRGIYTITWTPPAPTNGSFYQRLEYSYSSAYNVGPTYNGSFSTGYLELDQGQNQFIFDALYYTDYNFTITTINLKYNISNGPYHHSNQSSPTGIYILLCVYSQ